MAYRLKRATWWRFQGNITGNVIAGAVAIGIISGIFIGTYAPESKIIYQAEAKEVAVEKKEIPVLIEVKIDWTQARIEQEIKTVSLKYNVSYDKMWQTIKCESGFDIDIQSHHQLSYGREQSWGLSQIHLPAHPNITKEQAVDPAFAIDFMGREFARGNAKIWTCYRNLY